MKKVLWIVYWPCPQYVDIAKVLSKKIKLYLVLCNRYEHRPHPRSGYSPVYLPYLHYRHELVYFIGLEKAVREIQPDIIISTLCFMPASWQASFLSRKYHIRSILTEELKAEPRGILSLLYFKLLVMRIFNSLVFSQPDAIVCWTRDCQKFIKNLLPQPLKHKVSFVPPGITTQNFFPVLTAKENRGVLRLAAVSRLVKYKRISDLIKACAVLKNKDLKFRLTILGNGPELSVITALIKRLGLSREVQIQTTSIPHDQMKYFYAENDLLILPSFNEAIGMVVPEAMACGLPVIVSDTCGAKIYIEEGVNGSIFKTYDYEDLAAKIIDYRQISKTQKMGKAARSHINYNFNVQKTAFQFLSTIVGD